MLFSPAEFVKRPLGDLQAVLEAHSPDEIDAGWQGGVLLHGPMTATDATELLSLRPHTLLTTVTDCRLPREHPDVSLPGVVLDEYLGGGGQGWVYTARVQATGKHIAVKILNARSSASEHWAEREARICARLRHPNLLRVFELQRAGGYWIVLMELVQGTELRNVSIKAEQARALFGGLADGLCVLAENHVVHRDVKPSNIILREPDDSPVLIDFGTAVDLNRPDSGPPDISGTPFFMAPEALAGQSPEPSWDAYALGATAAVVLAGAYEQYKSLTTLRDAKASGEFDRRIGDFLPRIADRELRNWVGKLVQQEPAQRLEALANARQWAPAG
jgi:serine/threonine protein kinase